MLPHDPGSGCACFAADDLVALAGLRRDEGIRVVPAGERVWVAWNGDGSAVLERVLPLPGAQVYERREGLWYLLGSRLPSFGLPVDQEEDKALSHALVPRPLRPVEPIDRGVSSVVLALVREECARTTTALRCSLAALAQWADSATSAQLGAIRAAWTEDEVFLAGGKLPGFAGGPRYWGDQVWTPLGFRPEPMLGEAALREALRVASSDILVLESDGFEAIPRDAFRSVTRAGVRLAQERGACTA